MARVICLLDDPQFEVKRVKPFIDVEILGTKVQRMNIHDGYKNHSQAFESKLLTINIQYQHVKYLKSLMGVLD